MREWLKGLAEAERQAIGEGPVTGAMAVASGYASAPSVEERAHLPTRRIARVLLCLYQGHLIALHGFIKKSRAMPDEDLELARRRQKDLER